jgi:hypothetical protein
MEILGEYLRRAEECRKLALQTSIAAHREAIQKICDMWLKLADERRSYVKHSGGDGSPSLG